MTVLHQGVGQAAVELNISQPVVSKMLSNLEFSIGKELFYKKGRKKELTDYGQLLYRKCQVIFKEIDSLDESQGLSPTVLGIGGTEPIVNFLMNDILASIRESAPKCHFNIYTSTQNHLMELVANKKLDMAYSFYIPRIHPEVDVQSLETFRFHLVVKKGFERNARTMSCFIGSREIDDNSTHNFPTLSFHRKKWPQARITLSSNSISYHKKIVLGAEGVSILPQFAIKQELKRGSLIDIYPKKKFEWPLLKFVHKSSRI